MKYTAYQGFIFPFCILISIFISSDLKGQHIKLTWSPNPENDIKNYVIYRASTTSQETEIASVPLTDTSYLDYDIIIGETYYYRITAVDSADNISEFSDPIEVPTDFTTTVDPSTIGIPEKFYLSQNYPNPFNPETRFEYYVAKHSPISLAIYNLLGKKIRTLVNDNKSPGIYSITWDGRDEFSKKVASGIYFARFKAGEFRQTRKIDLQK